MTESQVTGSDQNRNVLTEKRITLISLVLIAIGIAGYFASRGFWFFYLFSHLGAIGVLGLLSALAGLIARKKGFDFMKAFRLGLLVPIALGVIVVFAMRYAGEAGTPFYCGGSVCLAAAILIIIGYSIVRKKSAKPGRI